jgi:threonine aldolase
MRQAGVLAAAALIALRDRDRLVVDHELASYLAERLSELAGSAVDPKQVETNMVQMEADHLPVPFAAWKRHLDQDGIKVNPPFGNTLRLVTHRDVDRTDVDRLVDTLRLAKTTA